MRYPSSQLQVGSSIFNSSQATDIFLPLMCDINVRNHAFGASDCESVISSIPKRRQFRSTLRKKSVHGLQESNVPCKCPNSEKRNQKIEHIQSYLSSKQIFYGIVNCTLRTQAVNISTHARTHIMDTVGNPPTHHTDLSPFFTHIGYCIPERVL